MRRRVPPAQLGAKTPRFCDHDEALPSPWPSCTAEGRKARVCAEFSAIVTAGKRRPEV